MPQARDLNAHSIQNPGDLWFFPAGMPHSLQATAASPDGAEFLLVSRPSPHMLRAKAKCVSV